ncbi:MAG: malto-oligosyltrehalose trehalohydrolase [Pirellulaceae bacterium]
MTNQRRLPIGAEVLSGGGAHFRVWAPKRKHIEVVIHGSGESVVSLDGESNGYFAGFVPQARVGDFYRYRLDGKDEFPDPASRFQPEGPHGPSQLVDPGAFPWRHDAWRKMTLPGQVIYEMHIGTFTSRGTWAAAAEKLPQLAELGITVMEIMPIADFPGEFGWGYDGVNMFAPSRLYGSPDDFRRFVDAAHGLDMGVILDVVYNHIGPDGNYLPQFSESYFSRSYKCDWGEALNFDDEFAGPVREFFVANAAYWIGEFRLDGLRLDATQQIFDSSPQHILSEISQSARAAAGEREIILVAENERQEARLVRPLDKKGFGLDGLWNDDFHHSARVALTGRNEAYYTDYLGTPQELLSAVKWGFLYQGQRYKWQKARRGHAALDLRPEQFITFIENHDQVANTAQGQRPSRTTSVARYRAMTALLLLAPGTPMLFQGQEFASTSPMLFFADHEPELARLVAKGRADFLRQFPSLALPEVQSTLPDPAARETFERCKLKWSEWEQNKQTVKLHADLFRLRREDNAFSAQRRHGFDGAVLSNSAFVLRFFAEDAADKLLLVNLGRTVHLDPAPEPLLAPPEEMVWQTLWSSEDVQYGGSGTPPLESDENWTIPGESAVVLLPIPVSQERKV